jgi:glycosyltransferase involved in cell wall biosynthesis/2-polyprenyl-3-methyl-5-hydroxy-6-metoxy-1,4-benzoquinol methylase
VLAAKPAVRRSQLLVFTTCYNEWENIGRLIDQIVQNLPHADILVVDDNSPDGTWEIIQEKAATYPQLISVKRPRKLGIGSAHKYALFYAMREGYKTLITMDADFSHDPKYLPKLLRAHGPGVFVTGSRYCIGGSSDYTGYRNIISRLGNLAARLALNVKLKELTTYYRVFDVDSLRSLPLRRVHAAGYSYGVQLIYYLRRAGVELREVPIHFTDRTHGASKIPRAQIMLSAVDLLKLAGKRLLIFRDLEPDTFVQDVCPNCGDRVLAMKHRGSRNPKNMTRTSKDLRAYQCTSVGNRNYPPVYTCLACGLEQVPESLMPQRLELFYKDVVDDKYLLNVDARKYTFQRAFDRIEPDLPRKQHPRMLEVGAYCGLFIKEAERRGWSAHGVEPSTWAARYARDVTGVCVHQGLLSENQAKLERKYDAVVSWDVLEHVRDPLRFLRECAEFLEAGGVFCFSTLDIDTWPPRLLGKRWPWLIDMHVHYFDRHVMQDMLARAGLELLRAESYTHYARLSYVITGAMRVLPEALGTLLRPLMRLAPPRLMVPVALGDIKLYVARKTAK